MLIKNQIYEAEITDYTAEGQGVAHIEGCAVFIPNAVAGEKVRVRVEKAQKTWAAGKIVEILEMSPHRVNRECEVAKLCGGCDFWHMDYAEETRLKAERVKTCLNRLPGENLTEVPILAARLPRLPQQGAVSGGGEKRTRLRRILPGGHPRRGGKRPLPHSPGGDRRREGRGD